MAMLFAAALALALIFTVLAGIHVFGAVDRARVQRFAARQALVVTADNGNSVICYLATTRRWRGGLLWLALVGYLCGPVAARDGLAVNFLAAFGGWFVGAVVAEWRVDSLARGPQASALLRVRRLTDYVSRLVVVLVVLVWSVAALLGGGTVVASLSRSEGRVTVALTLLAGALVAAVIGGVIRRILQRPQPVVARDLLEADNAIRGRSLNVLLGSALAIGGYLITVLDDQIAGRDGAGPQATAFVVGYLVLPALGIVVARGSSQRSPMVPDHRVDA